MACAKCGIHLRRNVGRTVFVDDYINKVEIIKHVCDECYNTIPKEWIKHDVMESMNIAVFEEWTGNTVGG